MAIQGDLELLIKTSKSTRRDRPSHPQLSENFRIPPGFLYVPELILSPLPHLLKTSEMDAALGL